MGRPKQRSSKKLNASAPEFIPMSAQQPIDRRLPLIRNNVRSEVVHQKGVQMNHPWTDRKPPLIPNVFRHNYISQKPARTMQMESRSPLLSSWREEADIHGQASMIHTCVDSRLQLIPNDLRNDTTCYGRVPPPPPPVESLPPLIPNTMLKNGGCVGDSNAIQPKVENISFPPVPPTITNEVTSPEAAQAIHTLKRLPNSHIWIDLFKKTFQERRNAEAAMGIVRMAVVNYVELLIPYTFAFHERTRRSG